MTLRKKILVTGAKGMVGNYCKNVFLEEELYLTDIETFDITDYVTVSKTVSKIKPDFVLHLAAATHVDRCEEEPDLAYRTNVIGTKHVALSCQENDIPLVYVSTGGVFNGKKETPYTEFDQPDPVNVYAKTKWEGEKIVQSLLSRYFIVRAGWMIGGGQKDKKFVAKMVECCQKKEDIQAVDDKWGTVTYAKDFLESIHRLIQTPFFGLYHCANQGICSRYQIALEVVRRLKSPVKVTPVPSDRFPLPAPRARSEAIANYKLQLMGQDNMSIWQEALNRYLKEWLS